MKYTILFAKLIGFMCHSSIERFPSAAGFLLAPVPWMPATKRCGHTARAQEVLAAKSRRPEQRGHLDKPVQPRPMEALDPFYSEGLRPASYLSRVTRTRLAKWPMRWSSRVLARTGVSKDSTGFPGGRPITFHHPTTPHHHPPPHNFVCIFSILCR